MLLFWDFEVFKYNWLVVIVDPIKKEETIIVNNADQLRDFMDSHKNYVFVSYNGKSYDNYICKAILAGYNPYDMNEWIITKGLPGWQFDDSIRNYNFLSYDVYTELMPSLKKLEAFMGMDIHESKVDFRLDRPLTDEEIQETIDYCRADVNALITVFCKRKADFESKFELIKMYNMPLFELIKTKAQLTATILKAERRDYNDEWDLQFPDNLKIEKYKFVVDWFKDPQNHNEGAKLDCEIAGIPTTFAWGGVHGAKLNYSSGGRFIDADVASLYPSIMLEYNLLSRSIPEKGKEEFRQIKDKRLKYKKMGEKKMSNALKICINALYGVSNFKGSPVYDPRQAHSVCLTGQLLLLDLIEHTECFGEIVNENTDGIYIKFDSEENEKKFYEACKEWETRTKLELEYDPFHKLVQRDVNNYIAEADSISKKTGKFEIKAKGAVVKDLSELDYDLPIVNFAVRNYLLNKIPPEKTVQDNDNLIDFQKIYHVSALYNRALKNCTFSKESYIKPETGRKNTRTVWNGDGIVFEHERTFRVFASKDNNEGALYKQKNGKNPEKFAGCPESCFIENGNIVGKKCSEYVDILDKNWYIDESWRRIEQFYGKAVR